MRKQRLTVGAAVALVLSLLGGPVSRAQAEKDVYDPNVSYDCDRACLNGFVDQYLAALVAHDPARLPLARDVKFTENGQTLKLGDGLWGTASAVTTHKIYADDPQAGQVLFLGALQENGAPIILALRLKVEIRRITEIETVVTRKEAGSFARPEAFVEKPIFSETLAPAERRSRQNMIAIANSYFSAIERGHGEKYVPFDKDCNRVEDGVQTTNNPSLNLGGSSTGTFGLGCAEQIKTGGISARHRDSRPPLSGGGRGARAGVRLRLLRSRRTAAVLHTHRRPHRAADAHGPVDVGDRGIVQDSERKDSPDRSGSQCCPVYYEAGLVIRPRRPESNRPVRDARLTARP